MFDLEAMKYVLTKVLACQTYNKAVVSEPVDMDFFNTHYFKYTVGDIVLCQEYDEEFSTKEKPWMTRRTTALLPIKFEVFEKWNGDFLGKFIEVIKCIKAEYLVSMKKIFWEI